MIFVKILYLPLTIILYFSVFINWVLADTEYVLSRSINSSIQFIYDDNSVYSSENLDSSYQYFSIINYDFYDYLGFGIILGNLKINELTKENIQKYIYEINSVNFNGHLIANLRLPLYPFLWSEIYYGYGLTNFQNNIYRTNNLTKEKILYKFSGKEQSNILGISLRFPLTQRLFSSLGYQEISKISKNENLLNVEIQNHQNFYFSIGYRFGKIKMKNSKKLNKKCLIYKSPKPEKKCY